LVALNSDHFAYEQQQTLQVIYDAFKSRGEWPMHQFVDLSLDRAYGIDFASVVSGLPDGLITGIQFGRPEDKVFLSVRGLALFPAAAPDIELFLRIVRWLVDRERTFIPSSPTVVEQQEVTSEDLSLDLQREGHVLKKTDLLRMYHLLSTEPYISAGGSTINHSTGQWTLKVPSEIRRYRGITSIQEYLAKRLPPFPHIRYSRVVHAP
jgi:hypothetical protein